MTVDSIGVVVVVVIVVVMMVLNGIFLLLQLWVLILNLPVLLRLLL